MTDLVAEHFKMREKAARERREAELQELNGFEAAVQSANPRTDKKADRTLLDLNKAFIIANCRCDVDSAFRLAGEILKLSKEGLENKPLFNYEQCCKFLLFVKERYKADIPELAAKRVDALWPGRYLRIRTDMDVVRDGQMRKAVLSVENLNEPYLELFERLLSDWADRYDEAIALKQEPIQSPIFPIVELAMMNMKVETEPSKAKVNMLPSFGRVPDPAPAMAGEPHTMIFGPARQLAETDYTNFPAATLGGWRRHVAWLHEVYRRAHEIKGVSHKFAFIQLVMTILRLREKCRDGGIYDMPVPTAEYIQWFYPDDWTHRARDWPKFKAVLQAMRDERLGVVSFGGAERLVMTVAEIPITPNYPRIVFHLRVPFKARHGAKIPNNELLTYFNESLRLGMVYLNAKTLVDLSSANGKPVSVLDDEDRKKYVPTLTKADLAYISGASDAGNRKYQQRAKEDLIRLHDKGVITLQESKKGCRIFGPKR